MKDSQQLLYYDPGVGTTDNFPAIGWANVITAYAKRLVGLAMADGIYENIGSGYQFLMENYQPGDRICLYGFSRGAFTARSIAGIVDEFGIMTASAKPLIPLVVRTYFSRTKPRFWRAAKSRADVATDIRNNFTSRAGAEAAIYFVGVWDTVASVGLFGKHITTDTDVRRKRYQHVRHAVSLDEQRWKYTPRLYTDSGRAPVCPAQTFTQLWFTGCHSDVGGTYRDADLSNIALKWMLDETHALGMRLQPAAAGVVGDPSGTAHDEAFTSPWWVLAGLCRRFRPLDASMDSSVSQRQGNRTVWCSLWRRPLFWVLGLLTLFTALLPIGILAERAGPFLGQWQLALYYQTYPSLYLHASMSFAANSPRWATGLDFLFIGSYLSFFSLLVVHARHGLRYSPTNRIAARLDALTAVGVLVLLVLADVAEDVTVLLGLGAGAVARGHWTSYVTFFTIIKLAAAALLVGYLTVVRVLSRLIRAVNP